MTANPPKCWAVRRAGRALWVSCLVLARGKASSYGSTRSGSAGEYRVGPGDVLDIKVFEVEELSNPAVVSPRGTVSLPLIGEVFVGQKTTLQIEGPAEAALRNQSASGPADQRQRARVSQPAGQYPGGRGGGPGVYQLQGRRRLVEVLAMAGGLTGRGGRRDHDLEKCLPCASGIHFRLVESGSRATVPA